MTEWQDIHRSDDPLTSVLGARDVTVSGRRASIQARVLRYLRGNPGSTSFHAAEALGLRHDQVWRRLSDLKNQGLAFTDGMTLAGTGSMERCWYAAPAQGQLL